MKYSEINGLGNRKFPAPVNCQQDGADQFGQARKDKDGFQEYMYVFSRGMGKGILHDPALLKGNVHAEELEKNHGEGHQSQSADLYQQQDDGLSECRKICAGIVNCQAGDAYGGRDGKKGIHKGNITGCR